MLSIYDLGSTCNVIAEILLAISNRMLIDLSAVSYQEDNEILLIIDRTGSISLSFSQASK